MCVRARDERERERAGVAEGIVIPKWSVDIGRREREKDGRAVRKKGFTILVCAIQYSGPVSTQAGSQAGKEELD